MEIVQEQVGDLVLLGKVLNQSGLAEILDEHYPVHGNWQGPSVGQLTIGWLMYIISECDHRVSHVESWAGRHLRCLRWALEYPNLEPGHFQDDRLGRILEYFSDTSSWEASQSHLNARLLRIYCLEPKVARLDSVNVTSFRDEQGLFQHGARKKHQAELPQLKVMLANLDPLGMPLACQVVAGHRADDQLYVPIIEQAQESVPKQGMLYVGDSKLGNKANFAFIARSENYYLCPLSQHQYAMQQLMASLDQMKQQGPPEAVKAEHGDKAIALIYELPPSTNAYTDDQGQSFSWSERLLLVQSPEQARRQREHTLDNIRQAKIDIAERFLPKIGRKLFRADHPEQAQAFIEQILKKYKVQQLIRVQLHDGIADPKSQLAAPLKVSIEEDASAIEQALQLKGWRVFATNAPVQMLEAQDLIRCYHSEYLIEQQFHRLLTKTTALMPVFLRKEQRIEALIRLLILALQLTSLIQYKAREQLQLSGDQLTNIIPGNPGRKVKQPTCEAMLKTFCPIVVVWVILPDRILAEVKDIRPINLQILKIIGLNPDLYRDFALSFKDVKELTIFLSET